MTVEDMPIVAQAAIIFTAFAFLWVTSFWLIAELGGWGSLAKVFETNRQPSGDQFIFVSGKCNFISTYNNCLSVAVTDEGIRLQPMLLFRFAHKPLFIPWSAIPVMGARREFFRHGIIMEINKPTGVQPLTLYGRPLSESIMRCAPERLLKPPELAEQ